MFDKDTIFSEEWVNLIFENLNKNYGAFILRKKYKQTLGTAVLVTFGIFIISFTAPFIASFIMDRAGTEVVIPEGPTNLAPPPPIDPNEPPPPPVEPPPPLKSTVKFTPPAIVKEEEATDEPPPTQEQLQEVDAGAKTEEGDSINGQDLSLLEGPGEKAPEPEQVFTIVEQMPSFPGGDAELFKYLSSRIRYPAIAKDNNITGTVYIQFVVDKEGKVTNAKVVRGIGGGCDEEALRVVNGMPNWKPGKQAGTPVQVMYNLPVKFTLR